MTQAPASAQSSGTRAVPPRRRGARPAPMDAEAAVQRTAPGLNTASAAWRSIGPGSHPGCQRTFSRWTVPAVLPRTVFSGAVPSHEPEAVSESTAVASAAGPGRVGGRSAGADWIDPTWLATGRCSAAAAVLSACRVPPPVPWSVYPRAESSAASVIVDAGRPSTTGWQVKERWRSPASLARSSSASAIRGPPAGPAPATARVGILMEPVSPGLRVACLSGFRGSASV